MRMCVCVCDQSTFVCDVCEWASRGEGYLGWCSNYLPILVNDIWKRLASRPNSKPIAFHTVTAPFSTSRSKCHQPHSTPSMMRSPCSYKCLSIPVQTRNRVDWMTAFSGSHTMVSNCFGLFEHWRCCPNSVECKRQQFWYGSPGQTFWLVKYGDVLSSLETANNAKKKWEWEWRLLGF